MEYWIKRDETQFGPYSLAGLQAYLQSGNLVKDDLTRSEGMTDWAPLWQVLGSVPVPAAPAPGMAAPGHGAVEEQARHVKLPPNLPWWVVLILQIVTVGMFSIIWSIVLGSWSAKLSKNNTALVLVSIYAAAFATEIVLRVLGAGNYVALFSWAALAVRVVGMFRIRSDMEQYYNTVERLGLSMSGPMVFFFGVIYLQYHVNSLSNLKKMLVRV